MMLKMIYSWAKFINAMNGLKINYILKTPMKLISITADASNKAFGACYPPYWIYGKFIKSELLKPIHWKEMFVLNACVNAWGHLWSGHNLLLQTDNSVVYYAVKKKYSRIPALMGFIRSICTTAIKYQFRFWISEIRTKPNHFSDALSRSDFIRFRRLSTTYKIPFNNDKSIFVKPIYLE